MNPKNKLIACIVIAFITAIMHLAIMKNAYEIAVALTATKPTYVNFDPSSEVVLIGDESAFIKGDNSNYSKNGEVCDADPNVYCDRYPYSAKDVERAVFFHNFRLDRQTYREKEELIGSTNQFVCVTIYLILALVFLKALFDIVMPNIAKKAKEVGNLTSEVVQRISKSESKLNNELKLAQEEFARLKNFLDEGLISEVDFDKGKASVQQKIHTIMSELEMLKSKTEGVSEV